MCYRVETPGSRVVVGHWCGRRGTTDMMITLHPSKRVSHCACVLSSLSCVFVFSS